MMRCGSCGGYNAEYFTWLGVTSVRCPDCGADLSYPITTEPCELPDTGYYAYSDCWPGLLGDGETRQEATLDLIEVINAVWKYKNIEDE